MLAEEIAGCRAAGILPPNRAAALVQSAWLAEQFPGCGVAAMDAMPQLRKGKPGRPRLHESEAVRNARHRARRREEFMADLAAIRALARGGRHRMAESVGAETLIKKGLRGTDTGRRSRRCSPRSTCRCATPRWRTTCAAATGRSSRTRCARCGGTRSRPRATPRDWSPPTWSRPGATPPLGAAARWPGRAPRGARRTPAWAQRSKRVQADRQGPNPFGRSRQGECVRCTHKMALTISRLLWLGLPGRPRSGGRSGSISRHWPSVSSILATTSPAKRGVGSASATYGNQLEGAP
jgi:hypothetical protein